MNYSPPFLVRRPDVTSHVLELTPFPAISAGAANLNYCQNGEVPLALSERNYSKR